MAEVMLEGSCHGKEDPQVVQHSSLLEHSGNVTALTLSGKGTLVSGSRDRSTVNLFGDNSYDGEWI